MSTVTAVPATQEQNPRVLAAKLREDLKIRIQEARANYKQADAAIKRTMSLMPVCPGRKPKLSLSLDALTDHMQQRERRARMQHQLQLMVPLERVIRIRLQFGVVRLESPTSKLFAEISRSSELHGATVVAQELLTKHADFFGVRGRELLGTSNDEEIQEAEVLHQKLRDSGMLQGDDLHTLNKVFARYVRMLRK